MVVWVARELTKKGRNAIGLLVIGSVLSLGLLATPLGQSSRLSQFKFQGSNLSIAGFGKPFSLLLCSGNSVRETSAALVLNGKNDYVSLPLSGRWSYQGMVVDAFYIANEFRGRSLQRDENGKRLSFTEYSTNVQANYSNKN